MPFDNDSLNAMSKEPQLFNGGLKYGFSLGEDLFL